MNQIHLTDEELQEVKQALYVAMSSDFLRFHRVSQMFRDKVVVVGTAATPTEDVK